MIVDQNHLSRTGCSSGPNAVGHPVLSVLLPHRMAHAARARARARKRICAEGRERIEECVLAIDTAYDDDDDDDVASWEKGRRVK